LDARDRAAGALIREALSTTLFVEAGAGTGKTSALVDRVVALVLSGKRIERLVAITFTEKAATELRDRVRSGLESARTASPALIDAIDTALASLDRAPISTIHAFCQHLLHSFAAEAGIDPTFQVQDEVQTERRFQDRWRMYLEDAAADAQVAGAIDRALGLGLTPDDIEKLASELMAKGDLAWQLNANPKKAPAPLWPNVDEMSRDLGALPLDLAAPDDKLRLRMEQLISLVDSVARAGSERESLLASGVGVLCTKWRISSIAEWGGGGACQRVRDAATAVCERLLETLESCRSEALAALLLPIARFVLADSRDRGRSGLLTFDDLILGVRNLLRESPEAIRSLRDRYDVILIDEFQDTDPLQVDIARSFATHPEQGRLEQGRLFLVGDPKQSIYRFRGADMAIYAQTKSLAAEQGAQFAELALNRRSRPAILDWVNSVFAELIGGGDDPAVQPSYNPIHPSRDDLLVGPGVAWMGGELEGMGAREARQVEARALASQCQAVLDEGWQVISAGANREASFRDIAILIPVRTILAPLERALGAAGIPYRVEGGSLIYRTQEVRDLINCLTAIDDPGDEVAIVGALRSPAFACSDAELARHKASGGRFNYLSGELAGRPGSVADALIVLARYHAKRNERSLTALAEEFASERGLVEVGILDQGSRNSFRRVRFVIEQARAFEANGPESLRAFVVWMERRSSEAILDNEGGGVDDDEDAVRVLTIHAAKGLEFPIVFVAGLSWSPTVRRDTYNVDRITGEVAVSIGAKTDNRRFTLGKIDDLLSLERDHENAQHPRLLYVAATRARDHLMISLYHTKRTPTGSGVRRLIAAGARELALERLELPEVERVPTTPFSDLTVDLPYTQTPEAFAVARTALVGASKRKIYTSATALARRGTGDAGDERDGKDERHDETEPWARGRGGTQRGRAVHAAIQSLPLDADDTLIDAFSHAQAVAEAIPTQAGEVAALVRWVFQSSQAMARARVASRALREVPFAVEREDGVVLEGFVDLLIETPHGIELVDWKTDQISTADVPARLEKYKHQAGLYVLGIQSATRRPVTRVTYVFAGARVEQSLGDPQVLAEAAELELARMKNGGAI
jgi:ATP-dependent helicase/nuclease subunit A